MKRLQVNINNSWEYVFCRNEQCKIPITTKNKLEAIRGNNDSLTYFKNNFGSLEFRII